MVRLWSLSMALAIGWFIGVAAAAQPPGESPSKPAAQGGQNQEAQEEAVESPAKSVDDAADAKDKVDDDDAPDEKPARVAVTPKPLSASVVKGIEWLLEHQHANGGWGQGEESRRMHRPALDQNGAPGGRDLPNVADTAMATLALIRSGSTPSDGPHSTPINRAIEFMCESIEAADDESLWITSVRGTRVQQKIGPYIDTFLAALVLAEIKDNMPTPAAKERVDAALAKTLKKIEGHQGADGQWAGAAWAGGLSNAFAVKAINRMSQSGVVVDQSMRQRAMALAQSQSQPGSGGRFRDDGRSAGVELYAAARAVGELNDAVQTNAMMRGNVELKNSEAEQLAAELEEALAQTSDEKEAKQIKSQIEAARKEQQAAQAELQLFDEADADMAAARIAVARRMRDDRFVAGFGTNGGEEFISYLNIGETLVAEGGEAWEEFDRRMTENLSRVQNDDGSWTGHHCITGRTFCTASALLVLMVDRSPSPVVAALDRK